MDTAASSRHPARAWRWRLAAIAVAWLVCELMLWAFVRLPHPYAPTDVQRRDQQVVDHLQGAPPNRYLPSYHTPVAVRVETDGTALPGVAGTSSFTINSFGFRSPRLRSVEKPPGTRRVFCIGGSTTECLYLDDAQAWPELVQQLLADVGNLDVVNAGHSGDLTRDHVALLAQRVVAFAPDVVLFHVGINDCFQQMAADHSVLRDDARARPRQQEGPRDHGLKALVCDVSQIARCVVLVARGLSDPVAGAVTQDPHGGWVARERAKWRRLPWTEQLPHEGPLPEFGQNLRSLVGLCRAHGAVPVFITQPALWGSDDPACEQLFWRRPPDERRVPHAILWRLLERFNDVTRAVAAEHDCPLVDLARLLPKQCDLFYDDDHVNVAGASVVARIVAEGLRAAPAVALRLGLATTVTPR